MRRLLLSKLGISDMKSFWQFLLQFLKFGLVGVSNTVISLGIYYLLVYLGVHYIAANTVGFVISVLNSFFWNSKFVFKENKSNGKKVLLKTFLAYGTTFLLSTLLLYLMVDKWNVSEVIAPLINLVITVPLNFLINKFFVYRENN